MQEFTRIQNRPFIALVFRAGSFNQISLGMLCSAVCVFVTLCVAKYTILYIFYVCPSYLQNKFVYSGESRFYYSPVPHVWLVIVLHASSFCFHFDVKSCFVTLLPVFSSAFTDRRAEKSSNDLNIKLEVSIRRRAQHMALLELITSCRLFCGTAVNTVRIARFLSSSLRVFVCPQQLLVPPQVHHGVQCGEEEDAGRTGTE